MFAALLLLVQVCAPDLSKATANELVSRTKPQDLSEAPPAAPSSLELVRGFPKLGSGWQVRNPATGQWEMAPAVTQLLARIKSGERLDIESWRVLLLEKGYLRWRRKWPIREPFAVSLRAPGFTSSYGVRLVPHVAGWRPAEASHHFAMCGLGSDILAARESYQELGDLRAGQTSVRFELYAGTCNSEQLCPGGIEIDVEDRKSVV